MSEFDTTQHFDAQKAEAYDRVIRQVVPGYDVLHEMIKVLLTRYVTKTNAKLLSVGCGTGVELITMGHDFPDWSFVGVEPAPAMASVAQANMEIEQLSDRCEVYQGFVEDLDGDVEFDVACLILVMHFVPDDGSKEALLRSIASRLKPGAPLVLADLHAEVEGERLEKFLQIWRDWQLHKGMPEHIVDRGFEHVVRDIQFVSEERIMELLHSAGFKTVEPFYGAFLFGGWIAWKE
ncbi:SAM-dependent methyltransferase [Candidatus Terasakiella magnetica]|uniref:SAM-dependent methyltransferase n=1 Tax=Candidatus Terasakiella magnetica TaxID=1867952 RepID=A0A1C3RGM7_9PROT|nr:class I SAM-dependent methyltransferase [Candidatus Terasakiella magnetica]SCA56398.1 SAM-dependent methyltransferase [Candidatus Terasakiella magnetica]